LSGVYFRIAYGFLDRQGKSAHAEQGDCKLGVITSN